MPSQKGTSATQNSHNFIHAYRKSLCSVKNALPKQVKLRSAISLSLDQLEAGDLPLAPRESQSRLHRSLILIDPCHEGMQIERILEINHLQTVTKEVVEKARERLVLG
jgi:hypothetical protein